MGLRDELNALPEGKASPWKVDLILAQLSEEDASELREILADPAVTSAGIAKVLKARNLPVSERAIQRYRSEHVFA